MKQSHMPLKLRKISFEYHQEVLGTTSVALVPCPTGTCVLSNKRRYDRSAEVRPHFFERFQFFVRSNANFRAFFRVAERENGTMVAQNTPYNTEATCAAFSDSAHGMNSDSNCEEIMQNKG
jgi:hypothetical protein